MSRAKARLIAVPLALGLSGLTTAAMADPAPVPENYDAPLSKVTVSTVWEAPPSTVSLFYTKPSGADTAALEEALDAKQKSGEKIVQLSDRFLFDFGSADLRPTAGNSLDTLVELLSSSKSPVEIIGHTDSVGSDDANQTLSEERAAAVSEYLVKNGVDKSRITTSGKGASEPVADNTHPDGRDNPEGRQQNRRVEIRYSDS